MPLIYESLTSLTVLLNEYLLVLIIIDYDDC